MNEAYRKILRHPEWFRKRKIILMRDNHRCRNCVSRENLNVHHRQYHSCKKTGRFRLPWQYKLKYLITLCGNCHETGHLKYKVPSYKI